MNTSIAGKADQTEVILDHPPHSEDVFETPVSLQYYRRLSVAFHTHTLYGLDILLAPLNCLLLLALLIGFDVVAIQPVTNL